MDKHLLANRIGRLREMNPEGRLHHVLISGLSAQLGEKKANMLADEIITRRESNPLESLNNILLDAFAQSGEFEDYEQQCKLADRIARSWEVNPQGALSHMLLDTFLALDEDCRGRISQLEERISLERETGEGELAPVVSMAVCEKEDAGRQLFLSPVISDEKTHTPGFIASVFMDCDYPTIKKSIGSVFPATVTTATQTLEIQAGLRYSQGHLKKIEDIYRAFIENGQPWTTVNAIYAYKFLDIYSLRHIDEAITGFTVDLKNFTKHADFNKALLWNIDTVSVPVTPVAVSAGNAVKYEYTINGLQPGLYRYLVRPFEERPQGFECFWRGPLLCLRTYAQSLTDIKLLRFCEREDARLCLPVTSNKKENSFTQRLAKNQARFTPSRGEAERIIRSLRGAEGVSLTNMEIIPPAKENTACYECLDFNRFIEMNAFQTGRKLLLFTFKVEAEKKWAHEIMFFVLSELQYYFTGFRCVGELA